jgi:hypothetical protein
MYEDRPEKDTPQWIQDELAEYGGLSPDGQSIWRLVLAQNCRIHCFGPTNQVAPGKIQAITDTTRPTENTPDRIIDGEHWIPRFHVKGWILQHWYPASHWGSRLFWEGQKARDGRTRLLAAYPQRGDYLVMPCGPWRTLAEVPDLRAAIRSYNFQQRSNPVNWQNDILAMTAMEAFERNAAAEAFAEELEVSYRMGFSSVLKSVSASAQRVRNRLAESVGGVNLGASSKWG